MGGARAVAGRRSAPRGSTEAHAARQARGGGEVAGSAGSAEPAVLRGGRHRAVRDEPRRPGGTERSGSSWRDALRVRSDCAERR